MSVHNWQAKRIWIRIESSRQVPLLLVTPSWTTLLPNQKCQKNESIDRLSSSINFSTEFKLQRLDTQLSYHRSVPCTSQFPVCFATVRSSWLDWKLTKCASHETTVEEALSPGVVLRPFGMSSGYEKTHSIRVHFSPLSIAQVGHPQRHRYDMQWCITISVFSLNDL